MARPQDKAALGREAISVLSLLYHHGPGKHYEQEIAKLDLEVPGWRPKVYNLPEGSTRQKMLVFAAWDRAIKVLKEAGIIT